MNIKGYVIFIVLFPYCFNSANAVFKSADSLYEESKEILLKNLYEQEKWVKVHAAEYLLSLGYTDQVKRVFKKENNINGNVNEYRIGIWRVLYQAVDKKEEKEYWLNKILKAYTDKSGKDRIHAVETLSKLRIRVDLKASKSTKEVLKSKNKILKAYTYWSLSLPYKSEKKGSLSHLFELIESANEKVKKVAAYALRHHKRIPVEDWKKLAYLALVEPKSSEAYLYLLSAGLVTAPPSQKNGKNYINIKNKLLRLVSYKDITNNFQICETLALAGQREDIPILAKIIVYSSPEKGIQKQVDKNSSLADLNKLNADVRSAAAYAILKILKNDA